MSDEEVAQVDPNLLRHLRISPQLLEVVADDPEQLAKLHRIQRALLSEKATRQCLEGSVTVGQIATVIEALRKAEGSREAAAPNSGNGFFFQIVMPNSGKSIGIDTRPPIEGVAKAVGQ